MSPSPLSRLPLFAIHPILPYLYFDRDRQARLRSTCLRVARFPSRFPRASAKRFGDTEKAEFFPPVARAFAYTGLCRSAGKALAEGIERQFRSQIRQKAQPTRGRREGFEPPSRGVETQFKYHKGPRRPFVFRRYPVCR